MILYQHFKCDNISARFETCWNTCIKQNVLQVRLINRNKQHQTSYNYQNIAAQNRMFFASEKAEAVTTTGK